MAEEKNGSLADGAYNRLIELLISGKLAAGMKVSQQKLARELEMGITPIREAIARLCEDGLLYQKPQSGTYVVEPDRQSLIEAYEVRIALERFAAQQAAQRIRPAELKILRKSISQTASTAKAIKKAKMETLDEELTRQFLQADILFHSTILNTAGNMYLNRLVTAGQIRNRVFGMTSHRRDIAHIGWVVDIHTKVVDAIEAGDSREAADRMEAHIRRSMDEALQAFDRSASAENPTYGGLAKTAAELQNLLINPDGKK